MKIRLLTARATKRTFHAEGDVVELADAEAKRLIASGQAVPERDDDAETAVRAAPERATRRGRGRYK